MITALCSLAVSLLGVSLGARHTYELVTHEGIPADDHHICIFERRERLKSCNFCSLGAYTLYGRII